MVMGDGYCSRGCGFESQRHKLDGHFSHLFVVNIVMWFEKMRINEKRPGLAHFKQKNQCFLLIHVVGIFTSIKLQYLPSSNDHAT